MCGIAAIVGRGWQPAQLEAMLRAQDHRGPDANGCYLAPSGAAGLAHNRLSIIDLSPAGRQPMSTADGHRWLAFNGEIYNYLELRAALPEYPFHSRTDSEVILAAFEKWGTDCLSRFLGMFAFVIWDEREQTLFGARDRFGVKPIYYAPLGAHAFAVASEIKALHAAGVDAAEDASTWAAYLARGQHDHSERTFWKDVRALPPGHAFVWRAGTLRIWRWYDMAENAPALDDRETGTVTAEYLDLLRDSVRLRFRSDVPVGINLSGGLDSSVLLSLVRDMQGEGSQVEAFTFVTGDPLYDETPWVRQMLAHTKHPLTLCELAAGEVPALAAEVQAQEDEPFGGVPTLAYARLFERAREKGVIVLLDGQGMDEQWAGYDYYRADAAPPSPMQLQGTADSPVRPGCLTPEFRALAPAAAVPEPFPDRLRNLQYRDACFTKIPRALRFNDRVSMRASTELREPFLDHRLFELAMRQPADRKIRGGTGKWLLRQMLKTDLPVALAQAPKRPLQTPQREWLRGPLQDWADQLIEQALGGPAAGWLDSSAVRAEWRRFRNGESDNSFYVWQWISLALMQDLRSRSRPAPAPPSASGPGYASSSL